MKTIRHIFVDFQHITIFLNSGAKEQEKLLEKKEK